MGTEIYLGVLCVVTVCLLVLTYLIYKTKSSNQISRFFIFSIISMLICNIGYIVAVVVEEYYGYSNVALAYMPLLGEILLPVSFIFLGLLFTKSEIRLSIRYLLFLVIPALTILLMFTNHFHGLFFKEYISFSNIIYGSFFIYVHLPWTYGCVLVGLSYFIRFSVKNAGFFSKQAMLLVWGGVIPLSINALWVIGNATDNMLLKFYSEYDMLPISFTFTIICLAFAIFKFDFLNVVPIALQQIVDIISDGFIVIDEQFDIIDFNRSFLNIFGKVAKIKRKENFIKLLENNSCSINAEILKEHINRAKETKSSVLFEKRIYNDDFDKYFSIEITPIYSNKIYDAASTLKKIIHSERLLGIIILLKDITEHKSHLKAIQDQQEILLEQERLASLGQLIGGIAHNLKTPIMSLSGGIEALKDLVNEYEDSIGDKSVTDDDHREIAGEMMSWLDRMKPYCSYMSDVISAVKGQAVQMSESTTCKFTVDELIKRVNLLMKHELKKFYCVLNIITHIDMETEIRGEVNNLVQVFDNIIMNAIQAYEGQKGTIDLEILRSGDNVEFIFRDYGKGIPKEVEDKLFKEMVTTKGKNGTGLGLYMSHSTIKGRFSGNMSFTSREGEGTKFLISVPCITYKYQEAE